MEISNRGRPRLSVLPNLVKTTIKQPERSDDTSRTMPHSLHWWFRLVYQREGLWDRAVLSIQRRQRESSWRDDHQVRTEVQKRWNRWHIDENIPNKTIPRLWLSTMSKNTRILAKNSFGLTTPLVPISLIGVPWISSSMCVPQQVLHVNILQINRNTGTHIRRSILEATFVPTIDPTVSKWNVCSSMGTWPPPSAEGVPAYSCVKTTSSPMPS